MPQAGLSVGFRVRLTFSMDLLACELFSHAAIVSGPLTMQRIHQAEYSSPRTSFLFLNYGACEVATSVGSAVLRPGRCLAIPVGVEDISVRLTGTRSAILFSQVTLDPPGATKQDLDRLQFVEDPVLLAAGYALFTTFALGQAPESYTGATATRVLSRSVAQMLRDSILTLSADLRDLYDRAWWVARVLYPDSNFDSRRMVELCGVPLRTLQHELQKHGTSPAGITREIRRRKALDLLEYQSQLSDNEVARRVGLSSGKQLKKLLQGASSAQDTEENDR